MELSAKPFIFAKNKREIKKTYIEAFPKKERMPFVLMVFMSLLWNTRFITFYDGDIFCGLIYMASIGRQSFIMFFAVPEHLRSKGYGASVLAKIKSMYPKNKIIVSVEPCDGENPELCIRRRNFYIRNGYERSGYMMKLSGQRQEILVSNGIFNKGAFFRFFALYSNCTVFPEIWKSEIS